MAAGATGLLTYAAALGKPWVHALRHFPLWIALAVLTATAGAALSIYNLCFGLLEARPTIFMDQFRSVLEAKQFADGQFGLRDLFQFHNEHRIVTTRVSSFVDAFWFDFGNRSLIATTYALLALLAAVIVRLMLGRQAGIQAWLVALPIVLAALWTAAQYQNLAWGFQPQFAYVHLFAALTLVAFAALSKARSGRRVALWMALLAVFDLLCIFSLASGLLVVAPVMALAVWQRGSWRIGLIFALVHGVLAFLYLQGLQRPVRPPTDFIEFARFFLAVIGYAFRPTPNFPIIAGGAGFVVFLGLFVHLTWQSVVRRQRADIGIAVLVATAAFVVVEAAAISRGRGALDVALAPSRYATPSIVFWAALLGASWRLLLLRQSSGSTGWLDVPRSALVGVIAATILGSNLLGGNYGRWGHWYEIQDRNWHPVLSGVTTDEILKRLYPNPAEIRPALEFLRERKLGPFAPGATRLWLPETFATIDRSTLPACRGVVESFQQPTDTLTLRGWLASPSRPETPQWLAAYDGAGRQLGWGRPQVARPDIQAALASQKLLYGFALKGLPALTGPVTLVGMMERGEFCALQAAIP